METIKNRPGYSIMCIAGLLAGKAAAMREAGGDLADAACDLDFLAEQLREVGSNVMENFDGRRELLTA